MSDSSLRVLIVEDNVADAQLVLRELQQAGLCPNAIRVDTEAEFLAHLTPLPRLILCDYDLPQFDPMRALALLQERGLDIPFLIVSGSIGEEVAVEAMKQGATDYLFKDRLKRLGPAVRQALAQRRLREMEHQAELQIARDAMLLASVRDSVIVLDREGIVTYWNDGATHLFGWSADEMLGRRYVDRLPEPYRSTIAQIIRERGDGSEWCGEIEDYRKDGTRVWVYGRATCIKDKEGKPEGILGLAYDISDRKRAEEERATAIRQQQAFLRDVLFSVTEGHLSLCTSEEELPVPYSSQGAGEAIPLTAATLADVRHQVKTLATRGGFPEERTMGLMSAASECAMNAVTHGGEQAEARVLLSADDSTLQVWVQDHGSGIDVSELPKATLMKGYSGIGTVGGFGHGFFLMLKYVDRIYLLTGPQGTTVVMEQRRVPPPEEFDF